jgi:transaldolase
MSEAKPGRLCRLHALGQSVWLDDISRPILRDGTLARLISEDCISGLTSNPAIFERALRESNAYDADIARLAATGAGVHAIYERLTGDDIRGAADLLRPAYDAPDGEDGYVSLEVSPHLARDADGTIAEASRLWAELDRPNVMIKVPGTREGLPAIRALIARGINVNVTLLFSPARYTAAADAYVAGLEDRLAAGDEGRLPQSVASFFLSRIDTIVDKQLDARPGGETSDHRGETAIALARIAYRSFTEICDGPRWRGLAAKGARPQRLLWASTGTKDPSYSDLKYVASLIAPDTVNTMPMATLDAFRDHGVAAITLSASAIGGDDLDSITEALSAAGVDLTDALAKLEAEGIEKFNQPFDKLHEALGKKLRQLA